MNGLNIYGSQEFKKGDIGYLLMDVDGCLIEAGLETAGNLKTVEDWIVENKENLAFLRRNIDNLRSLGLRVGLSTGRGLEFCKRLINGIYPERLGFLDKSILEGGLLIYDDKSEKLELSVGVDKKSVELLKVNKQKIIDSGESLGGVLEKGEKFVAISFNPSVGIDGKRDTDKFKDLLMEKLDPELVKNLVISNSTTGVDITPKGVDKKMAMENLVGEKMVIYLGDGKNDETSMRNQKVKIILAPGNSHEDIKKFIKSGEKFGVLAEESDIKGTNQMFGFLIEKMKD